MSLDNLFSFIIQNENILGYSILFISSVIEYVFPPFPGDTVTLFGAFLVAARGWNFFWVFSAATLGSVAGSSIDYMLGYRIKRWREGKIDPENHISRKGSKLLTKERFDFIKEKIDSYGPAYIILNRFMPGIRAFFFLAAGLAEMNVVKFSIYTFLGSFIWSALLTYVGVYFGGEWSILEPYFRKFQMGLGAIFLIFILWYINHKLRLIKFPSLKS